MHQLTPTIYLGNFIDACRIGQLRENRIKRVLSVINHEMPDAVKKLYRDNGIEHYAFLVHDRPSQDLIPYLEPCYSILSDNVKTLVHCHMGISRSASIVIYYMMRFHELDYDAAYLYIRARRRYIQPNRGFEAQLRSLEN